MNDKIFYNSKEWIWVETHYTNTSPGYHTRRISSLFEDIEANKEANKEAIKVVNNFLSNLSQNTWIELPRRIESYELGFWKPKIYYRHIIKMEIQLCTKELSEELDKEWGR